MNLHSLMFVDPPVLADETASEMLDFLYDMVTAFENHYAHQIRRYYQDVNRAQTDLFEDFNDELPPL